MKAYLILENGTVFEGTSIGLEKEVISEVVFNTSMMGYQEILTNPVYEGQCVCMTYPLVGNYGINDDDIMSEKIWADGLIVYELSEIASNFRSKGTLSDYLIENGVPGIEGIDTRKLTKILRKEGSMNGMITTKEYGDLSEVISKIKEYKNNCSVEDASIKEVKHIESDGFKVAVIDYGSKNNIVGSLVDLGCDVTIYPCKTSAEDIIASSPDGIALSNGPGDPKECEYEIEQIKKLYDTDIPIFATCLGHQLLALATGADTKKLKYGHRGGCPVKDLETGHLYNTFQSHGYVVDENSLDANIAEVNMINVNDKSVEGLKYKNKKIVSVQFYPEACPGPVDSKKFFADFMNMMEVK